MDADETGFPLGGGEVGTARLGPGVYACGGIDGEEPPQSVGVVIVPVGEDRQLHLAQIDPQGGGIVRELPRGARVLQQTVPPVLQVQGQPVL